MVYACIRYNARKHKPSWYYCYWIIRLLTHIVTVLQQVVSTKTSPSHAKSKPPPPKVLAAPPPPPADPPPLRAAPPLPPVVPPPPTAQTAPHLPPVITPPPPAKAAPHLSPVPLPHLAPHLPPHLYLTSTFSRSTQGRLTISNRYTHREIKLKFSALLKDYDLKYAENSKKMLLKHAPDLIYRSICRNSYF